MMSLPSWEDWDKTTSTDLKKSINNHNKGKTSSISNIENLSAYSTNNIHYIRAHEQDVVLGLESKSNPKLTSSNKAYYQSYQSNGNNDIIHAQSEMIDIKKTTIDNKKVNFNSMNNNASLNNNSSVNNNTSMHHQQQYQNNMSKSYENIDIYDSSSSHQSSISCKDQRQFNEFKCREICLSTTNKLKYVLDYISKVKEYILKEGSLELEVSIDYIIICS